MPIEKVCPTFCSFPDFELNMANSFHLLHFVSIVLFSVYLFFSSWTLFRTMAVKEQKSKAAKALAAQKSNRGKKKKWSKQTLKEKANNAVVITPEQLKKFVSEASKYKSITPSVLVDRLKVNASVARRLIRLMENDGLVKPVIKHSTQLCYTRAGAA